MADIETLIEKLRNPSQMRLMMGELDANELLVAQAAIRYTLTQLSRHNIQLSENTNGTDYH